MDFNVCLVFDCLIEHVCYFTVLSVKQAHTFMFFAEDNSGNTVGCFFSYIT